MKFTPETKFGFDNERARSIFDTETLMQPVEIQTSEGTLEQYIVVKSPPLSVTLAPHRKSTLPILILPNYKDIQPREFLQFSVMTRRHFDDLLHQASETASMFALDIPPLPTNFDGIDMYSIDRVHHVMSKGDGMTLYLHPKKLFYFYPKRANSRTEDILRAAEIISIANVLPVYPVIDINELKKFELDERDYSYRIRDPLNSEEPIFSKLQNYDSLLRRNTSYYSYAKSNN